MITSMTGFGRGNASDNGIQVTVEIKTLNSRYLDITSRLPQSISDKELNLKEIVQDKIKRGKVNINVYVDKTRTGQPDFTFSPELVQSYGAMLEQIKLKANISKPVYLSDLMKFEDIFIRRPEDEETIKKTWNLTKQAMDDALDMVLKMRVKEGGQLKNELKSQVDGIAGQLDDVIRLSKERAPQALDRMKDRLATLLKDDEIDPERLEQEIAILVDKMDIQEEVIRLKSHLKFFLEALNSDDSVGRRLNFLSQEINRELNTIGSKSNDSEISHLVVYAKEKLEQIREQVQNIE
jgi:uncharacterized protein (TIGR00255 family)